MAISITNLSGGNTPADGSDPRTFPAIWNATATDLEGVAADLDTLEATVGAHDLNSLSGVGITTPVEGDLLTYNGTSWVNGVPAGSILQVVSTTKTDTFSASVATDTISADVTGLTATITPVATSSKILVRYSITTGVSNSAQNLLTILYRDGSAVGVADAEGSRTRATAPSRPAGSLDIAPTGSEFLDSPSSTSALVYSVRVAHGSSSTETIYVNRSSGDTNDFGPGRFVSSITLMEVAG